MCPNCGAALEQMTNALDAITSAPKFEAKTDPSKRTDGESKPMLGTVRTCGFCREEVPMNVETCPHCNFSLRPTHSSVERGAQKAMAASSMVVGLWKPIAHTTYLLFHSGLGFAVFTAFLLGIGGVSYYFFVAYGETQNVLEKVNAIKHASHDKIFNNTSRVLAAMHSAGAKGGSSGPFAKSYAEKIHFTTITLATEMPPSIPFFIHCRSGDRLDGAIDTATMVARYSGEMKSDLVSYNFSGEIDLKNNTVTGRAEYGGRVYNVYLGFNDGREEVSITEKESRSTVWPQSNSKRFSINTNIAPIQPLNPRFGLILRHRPVFTHRNLCLGLTRQPGRSYTTPT